MTLLQDTMISMQPLISELSKLSSLELLLTVTVAHLVFKFFLVVYRISALHPLAKVPGPRLAAATWWYRTYYEVWPHYGGMVDILEKLHVQYGPVVRIGPSEVHFNSPSAYLQIYSNASKVTKDPKHYHCYNEDETSFGFCNPAEAKERREIMQPFFSRRNLRAMHYVLEDKLCLFTHRLRSVYEENPSGHVINMAFATKSFTGDIITEFCFARTLDSLRTKPDFSHPLIMSTEKALAMFAVFKHFPLMKHVVNNIPEKILQTLMPQSSEGVRRLKDMVGKQLDEFLGDPEKVAEEVEHEVIYHRLLGVGKYEEKKEDGEFMQRSKIGRKSLHDEAQALVFAGMDTVGNALTIGTYYILSTPGVVDKLLDELKTVWPADPWMGMPVTGEEYKDGCGKLPATAQWDKLEKLPYLSGVIRESLRLSHGVTSPLQRLVSAQGLIVDGWTLPAGTGVSSGNTFIHLNPTIFPDPHTFRPERWIGEDSVGLEKYLVAFCKGPRQCLGINLAWCELYLTFATLYRRFEFEFAGTPPESLKFRDFFTPVWSPRTNVRVKPRLD